MGTNIIYVVVCDETKKVVGDNAYSNQDKAWEVANIATTVRTQTLKDLNIKDRVSAYSVQELIVILG